MMSWFGGMSLLATTLLLLWMAAVLLLVWTVWTRVVPLSRPPGEAPLDILKRRYAAGEISRAAYEQARQVLERADAEHQRAAGDEDPPGTGRR